MGSYIQVVTTAEKREDAEKIARTVVEKRLAGCVQILGPVTSIYWWKGNVETAEEWQCVMKSRSDLYGAVETAIISVHPYEVPEIIAVPITAGSQNYLDWLQGELF
ncbi:MAG: divalent-cation tolerance protein CutA [Deltaproteobacteria bacterium]|nr:divalent-cation tolerance protein CutA [Deltaproteobacteria bacterium]